MLKSMAFFNFRKCQTGTLKWVMLRRTATICVVPLLTCEKGHHKVRTTAGVYNLLHGIAAAPQLPPSYLSASMTPDTEILALHPHEHYFKIKFTSFSPLSRAPEQPHSLNSITLGTQPICLQPEKSQCPWNECMRTAANNWIRAYSKFSGKWSSGLWQRG